MLDKILHNWPYKLVSLFVSVILWMTLLGHRDASLTREVDLEFLLASHHQVNISAANRVVVRVSGPRLALREFSSQRDNVLVDLSAVAPGEQLVDLSRVNLNLPLGVELLSISPRYVTVNIGESNANEK